MKAVIPVESLYRSCPEELLDFGTTSELEPADAGTGQQRAVDAIHFAIDMPHPGYNLYLAGSEGMGKRYLVREIIAERPAGGEGIHDWCYVHNFEASHRPDLLRLPPGSGMQLKYDMDRLIERLLSTLPSMLQSDEYRARMNDLQEQYSEREAALFAELERRAAEKSLRVLRTPKGFTIAPVRDGKMVTPTEFAELPEPERKRIQSDIEELNRPLQEALQTLGQWQEESIENVREANHEFVRQAIDPAIQKLKDAWTGNENLAAYFERVHEDLIENAGDFFVEQNGPTRIPSRKFLDSPQFLRYRINVLVDNSACEHAPIVYEDNPTYQNLIGRIEHTAQMGALVTNFSLIKPGALHRANGGYLILDALKLLTNPFSYEALKRVLSAGEIRIESLDRVLSMASTTTLEPEPAPLKVKIVLIGNRYLYHLLTAQDPEFAMLFRVQADFSEEMDRGGESVAQYARFIAGIARSESLLPLVPGGVACVIEQSARYSEDSDKLSLNRDGIANLMREAHYHARKSGAERIEREHVEKAVTTSIERSARYRDLSGEAIEKGTVIISTQGEQVAQINGLSVYQLGDMAFGRPARITATARAGAGKVIDIERESELGGTIHTKAVMILSALLANRYAREAPLALTATLVFEQSYGPIDGDSASVAELLALLSAISSVGLKQSLAVTGSINQHGQVQAIGGVNHKIEGFYDVCCRRGLSGEQGVVIPASNVRHLMLRPDVVQACREGQFTVHSVETLDDAIELFTDRRAGAQLEGGTFEEGSFNRAVQVKLGQFAEQLRKSSQHSDGEGGAHV